MADVQIPGTSPLVRHPEKEPLVPGNTNSSDRHYYTDIIIVYMDIITEFFKGMDRQIAHKPVTYNLFFYLVALAASKRELFYLNSSE